MYCNIDWRNTATVCRNTWVVFFQDVSGDKAQTDLYRKRDMWTICMEMRMKKVQILMSTYNGQTYLKNR